MAALRKATEAMSKNFARRQVRDAVRAQNGPDVSDVHKIPIGGHVLAYRPGTDRWEGPFAVLDVNAEDIMVLLPPPSSPTKFCSTVVKRYCTPVEQRALSTLPSHHENVAAQAPHALTPSPMPTGDSVLVHLVAFIGTPTDDIDTFKASVTYPAPSDSQADDRFATSRAI